MPLKKFDSVNTQKEIENIINENVSDPMKTQKSFTEVLLLNGCPSIKLGLIGRKIRKQLLKEAKMVI